MIYDESRFPVEIRRRRRRGKMEGGVVVGLVPGECVKFKARAH